jgi:hydrogenase/urease accessory protein HupE
VKRGRQPSADLIAVAALAGLGALVAISSPSSLLQVVLAGPLVLLLPGYAIAAALFPPGALPRGHRFVYTFVFCVRAAVLGMLVLQLALDVRRTAWICLLLGITLAAAAIAWRRRRELPIQASTASGVRLPAGPLWVVGFVVATALAAVSIGVASDGVREQQSRQTFASLWADPTGPPDSEAPVEVGVLNHGGPTSYRLEVRIEGELVEDLPVRLRGRQQWQRTLLPPVTSSSPGLNVALVRGGERYRTVELNIQSEED